MSKRVWLSLVLLVVVAAILAAVAWFSPLFVANKIEVEGNQRSSVEEIEQAADIPQDAKLLPLSSKNIATRVSQLPWVARVSVHKQLPDTVVIEVSEHQPVGYIDKSDGHHIFNAEGTVFMISDDPAGATKVIGDDEASQEAAATVLAAIDPEQRGRIAEIEAKNPNAISLKLDNGHTIFWGSLENTHNKAVAMKAALAREEQFVDISAAPDIAVR